MNEFVVNVLPNEAVNENPLECPFIVELELDGAPFEKDYPVALRELALAAFSDGEAFPLTCGCGEPRCAGLYEPFRTGHSGGVTVWIVRQPGPLRRLTFETDRLREAVLNALREAERLTAGSPERAEAFPGWNARRYLAWSREAAKAGAA